MAHDSEELPHPRTVASPQRMAGKQGTGFAPMPCKSSRRMQTTCIGVLQRVQKCNELLPLRWAQSVETLAYFVGLAAMTFDGVLQG